MTTGTLAAVALLVLLASALPAAVVALGSAAPRVPVAGVAAALVVPVYGPSLVVVALVAAALAWPVRRRLRRAATVVAVACGLSGLAAATVVGVVLAAVTQAGGSVDLARAVVAPVLARPAPAAPDAHPVYTTSAEGRPLHLAVWRPTPATVPPTGPAPVFVYLHGGGWTGGSALGRSRELKQLADAGWLVVSVEYGLSRPGHPTWDTAGPQVACSLVAVAAGAQGYGGDPARIVLAGDSAGGQLAVSVGYHAASRTQASSCGGEVPVPRAIATDYPAVDLVDGYRYGATGGPPLLDARYLAVTYTGGTPEQVPDRYRTVSGAAALTPGAPPTLVIAPTRDSLVPPAGLARFAAGARAAGVDAELVPIPVADHAFDQLRDGSLGQQAGWSILEHWATEHAGGTPAPDTRGRR